MRVALAVADLEHPLAERNARRFRRSAAVAHMAVGAALVDIARPGATDDITESTVLGVLVVQAADEGAVVHAPTQHERLTVVIVQVRGHLQEVIVRLT